jgi:glycosyltransferase involved in cell wall biosynthesis
MIYSRENILLFIFIVFCIVSAIQVFYYIWFYLSPSVVRNRPDVGYKGPVSVIICARNEAENLKKHLGKVLEQDYPDFEVIVVNDCSEDKTYEVLAEYLGKYKNLKLSTIHKDPKFTHSKKLAQFIGIKAAANDILLFTDADCIPASPKWIEEMASQFGPDTNVVLGYGGYNKRPGLLNLYIRYDTMFIALQYLGFALRGIPYMGVGRNLAYTKSLFFAGKGFSNHSHIASGDDDLFINQNAAKNSTSVKFSHNSHTRSIPAASVEEWVKQKQRHLTTAVHYKFRDKILLITEPLSRVFFYVTLTVLLINTWQWEYVTAIALLRTLLFLTVLILGSKRLKEPGIVIFSLFLDIFSPLINLFLYIGNLRNKRAATVWK